MKKVLLLICIASILFSVLAPGISAQSECEKHVYSNDCDMNCNNCRRIRAVKGHVYSSDCDPDCDSCGYKRVSLIHTYDNGCDAYCNACSHVRSSGHVDYDGDGLCDNCPAYIEQGGLIAAGKMILLIIPVVAIGALGALWYFKRKKSA